MIRRLVLAVALAGFAAVTASAKAPGRKISIFQPKVPETETLASGGAEFVYDYKWCADTTARGTDSEDGDLMLLQTGRRTLQILESEKSEGRLDDHEVVA